MDIQEYLKISSEMAKNPEKDNYFTDDNGTRWVKLARAQSTIEALEAEIAALKQERQEFINEIENLECLIIELQDISDEG